jgi:hypothetical protein
MTYRAAFASLTRAGYRLDRLPTTPNPTAPRFRVTESARRGMNPQRWDFVSLRQLGEEFSSIIEKEVPTMK